MPLDQSSAVYGKPESGGTMPSLEINVEEPHGNRKMNAMGDEGGSPDRRNRKKTGSFISRSRLENLRAARRASIDGIFTQSRLMINLK